MENWFAIRSYQLVSWSIMVLMGTSVVKIRLRCKPLLRMLKCQICLWVIVNVNMLMRKVLIWVQAIPGLWLANPSLLLKLDYGSELICKLTLILFVFNRYVNLTWVYCWIGVAQVHLLGQKRDIVLVPTNRLPLLAVANKVCWKWLGQRLLWSQLRLLLKGLIVDKLLSGWA